MNNLADLTKNKNRTRQDTGWLIITVSSLILGGALTGFVFLVLPFMRSAPQTHAPLGIIDDHTFQQMDLVNDLRQSNSNPARQGSLIRLFKQRLPELSPQEIHAICRWSLESQFASTSQQQEFIKVCRNAYAATVPAFLTMYEDISTKGTSTKQLRELDATLSGLGFVLPPNSLHTGSTDIESLWSDFNEQCRERRAKGMLLQPEMRLFIKWAFQDSPIGDQRRLQLLAAYRDLGPDIDQCALTIIHINKGLDAPASDTYTCEQVRYVLENVDPEYLIDAQECSDWEQYARTVISQKLLE